MKLNDCISGEYYTIHFTEHDWIYIYKSLGGTSSGSYIAAGERKRYQFVGGCIHWRIDIPSIVRPATASEINWLSKCIKNDTFLERPSIFNIYGLRK